MLSATFSSFPLSSCCLANVLTRRTVPGQDVCFGLYLVDFCALQVAGLFHHASIGNPINIAIVRLILLENEEVKRKQNDSHFHPGSQTGILRELALKACKLSHTQFSWMDCVRLIQIPTLYFLVFCMGCRSGKVRRVIRQRSCGS